MRVLYFTRDYTPHDFRFLKAIVDNGEDVYFLRLEKRNQYESRPIPEGVHVVSWSYGQAPFDIETRADAAAVELARIFDELQPDVIHSGPLTDCSYITAKAGIHPHVAMSWGFDLGREIETSEAACERATFALKNADWFLGDCFVELDKAQSLGYPRERATIFPWGIDVQRFSPGAGTLREKIAQGADFLILSLRTMEPNYDVPTVVTSFLSAVKTVPNMRLILLGDGSQMPVLKAMAAADPDGDKVSFLGRQPNDMLVDYYRSCDLYVSASIVDGSSVSLLEAMGCGIPVLMSEIPGNQEWIREHENGRLFPVKDTRNFADKIIDSVLKQDEILTYARQARQDILEKADWDQNKKKIQIAYRNAIKP